MFDDDTPQYRINPLRVVMLTILITIGLVLAHSAFAGETCNGRDSCSEIKGAVGGNATAISSAGAQAGAVADVKVGTQLTVGIAPINAQAGSGGSAAGGNATVNTHIPDRQTIRSAPDAPSVLAHPTAPCRVAVGASASGIGFSVGVGSSVLDEGCDAREDSRHLHNLGLRDEAILRLCEKPAMARALKQKCPVEVSSGDPYIDRRTQ